MILMRIALLAGFVLGTQSLAGQSPQADSLRADPVSLDRSIAESHSERRLGSAEAQIQEIRAQLEPKKDFWDKVDAISELITGGIVVVIATIATLVFNERQRKADESRRRQELDILRVQTIKDFMPQLQSENHRAVEAALLAITALGDRHLATELARLLPTEGATAALSKIVSSYGPADAFDVAKVSIEAIAHLETDKDAEKALGFVQAALPPIRRGVRVSVIFIRLDTKRPVDKKVLREYKRTGISVSIARPEDEFSERITSEFVLVDEKLIFVPRYDTKGQISHWSIFTDRAKVAQSRQLLDRLSSLASRAE
jgi:hypothetical protein